MRILAKFMITAVGLFGTAALSAAPLVIDDGFIRGMPPGHSMTAAFLTLRNPTDTDIEVVDVEADFAGHTMLHTNVVKDGVAKMTHLSSINVAAQSEYVLQPGGAHIMFMRVKNTLELGKTYQITLVFKDGSKQVIALPVQKK